MKNLLTIVFLILSLNPIFSQKREFIGVNLSQLPASSININYEHELKPRINYLLEIGYTVNYQNSYDYLGYFISNHCDCYDYADLDLTNGAFFKAGVLINLRQDFNKVNYFNWGLFLIQSIVHEKGVNLEEHYNIDDTFFIFGLSSQFSYNFKITNKLSSNIGFQVSLASKNTRDLNSRTYFVPGMGRNELSTAFPMIRIDLKYRIK